VRTLSARILLSFAALTIAFGVITANTVVNIHVVEDEVQVVRNGFLPLALIAKDLARREEDLKSYLGEALQDDPNAASARMNLRRTRQNRDRALARTHEILAGLDALPEFARIDRNSTQGRVDQLSGLVIANIPWFVAVCAQPPFGRDDARDSDASRQALARLKDTERRIGQLTNELSDEAERRVRQVTFGLEENEHRLRLYTIYFGLSAVVLGLAITVWAVIALRPLRRLRDGARRVAAGDYASRIDERGPAEVRDLAREFNSMALAVEERERELVTSERLTAAGNMAKIITHEVRNPLSSIGLNTELLEEELAAAPVSAEARALCASIHREVDRLTSITESYLTFGRLPAPKLAREHVNAMVGGLAQFVREELAAREVELVVQLDAGDPAAMIDAGQIRQCLLNLVRNATEAVVAKGRGKVTLRTLRTGDRVVIAVDDEGTGIAPEILPKLFDPFFSTKESGSGLGLALTQQIVKDHGGELSVDSAVGRGTTFTLSLPAAT